MINSGSIICCADCQEIYPISNEYCSCGLRNDMHEHFRRFKFFKACSDASFFIGLTAFLIGYLMIEKHALVVEYLSFAIATTMLFFSIIYQAKTHQWLKNFKHRFPGHPIYMFFSCATFVSVLMLAASFFMFSVLQGYLNIAYATFFSSVVLYLIGRLLRMNIVVAFILGFKKGLNTPKEGG